MVDQPPPYRSSSGWKIRLKINLNRHAMLSDPAWVRFHLQAPLASETDSAWWKPHLRLAKVRRHHQGEKVVCHLGILTLFIAEAIRPNLWVRPQFCHFPKLVLKLMRPNFQKMTMKIEIWRQRAPFLGDKPFKRPKNKIASYLWSQRRPCTPKLTVHRPQTKDQKNQEKAKIQSDCQMHQLASAPRQLLPRRSRCV